MAYTKQNWIRGDVITAEKLNHMEDGIASGGSGGGGVEVAIRGTVEYDNTLSLYKVTFDKSINEILAMYESGSGAAPGVAIDRDGYLTRYTTVNYRQTPFDERLIFDDPILFRTLSDPTMPAGPYVIFGSSVDRTVPLVVYMDTLMSPLWTGKGGCAELYINDSSHVLSDVDLGGPILAGALAGAMNAYCDIRVYDGDTRATVCGIDTHYGSSDLEFYVSKLSIMTAEATSDETPPTITIKTFTASSATDNLVLTYTATFGGGSSGGSD